MKLPNNFGSIVKLTGARRKPYQARKCIGYELRDGKARRKYIYIGTYATKKEALEALTKYNENPYDVDARKLTVKDIYDKWWSKKSPELSESGKKNYLKGYKYIEPILDLPMADLKKLQIEQLNDTLPVDKWTSFKLTKLLLHQLYEYAIELEVCTHNYSNNIVIPQHDAVIKRIIFTHQEVSTISSMDSLLSAMIIVGLYTGLRPSELSGIKKNMINWDELTIVTGSKTDAGKDRVIPIHPRIRDILKHYYDSAKRNYLFTGSYRKYNDAFQELMREKGWNHTPHDTRHTFITQCKECELDEYCIKLIVGHSIADITERVYTHRTIVRLSSEMEKLSFDV